MMKNLNFSQIMELLYKKIEQFDKKARLAICCLTVGIIVVGFYFAVSPIIDRTKQYQTEFESTNAKLNVAKQKAMKLEALKNERKMKEMEFKKSMKALPETKEIPALLTSISQVGQDTGVEFITFEPKAEVSQGFYGEIPVNMEILGNYHNTVMFFDKVTSLNRIVNIRNIKMEAAQVKDAKEGSGTKLKTVCEAVTYKFIEQGQVAVDNNKNTKNVPPKK